MRTNNTARMETPIKTSGTCTGNQDSSIFWWSTMTSAMAMSAIKKTSLPSAPVSQPLALTENPSADTFHHAKKVERRSTTAPPPATHVERLTELASNPCVLMPPPVVASELATASLSHPLAHRRGLPACPRRSAEHGKARDR